MLPSVRHWGARTLLALPFLAVLTACGASPDAGSAADALREDPSRAPQIVRVPVRFTRNEVSDVGFAFSTSWLPFTGVSRDRIDGTLWGLSSPSTAEALESWFAPDHPGAGYGTAIFRIEIPYDASGQNAYPLARVKLESEFLKTYMGSINTWSYSPLRIRSGSDQPCLSITMAGALDGKLKAVPLPYTDEGFTEHDWKIGDVDAAGVPIKRVIVGTLRFAPYGWPENVEGKTSGSAGVGIPPGAFVMIDKSPGQGSSDSAAVFINLIENARGVVSLGDTFSTNAGILDARTKRDFDDAVNAFAPQFVKDVHEGILEGLALSGGS
jgi:hypothetical protein